MIAAVGDRPLPLLPSNPIQGCGVPVDCIDKHLKFLFDTRDRGDDVEVRPDHHHRRLPSPALRLFQRLRKLASFDVLDQEVDEGPAESQVLGNFHAPQKRDKVGIDRIRIGFDLLAFARAGTRYVTGAILAASRWLQRRAWVRRAADTAPRPSGATAGRDQQRGGRS